MVREAALLSMAGKINESIKLCNQANRVSKEYAEIYTVRSNNYINWAATNMRNVPRSTMLKMYDWAYRDAQTFQKLAPSDPYGPCLAAAILQFRTAIKYEHNPAAGAPTHREVEALMTRLLKLDRDDVALKAEAYTVRAAARSSLRDDDGALADYNAAIQILPTLAMGYSNRADFHEILGQHHQAAADRRRARELEQAAQQ